MSVTPERKQQIIAEYATHEGDTGSPEVQIAVLSERIANLSLPGGARPIQVKKKSKNKPKLACKKGATLHENPVATKLRALQEPCRLLLSFVSSTP